MLDMLAVYFHYPFVRYAMLVGVLIALSSSLLGVSLVLKRFSFIGDGPIGRASCRERVSSPV